MKKIRILLFIYVSVIFLSCENHSNNKNDIHFPKEHDTCILSNLDSVLENYQPSAIDMSSSLTDTLKELFIEAINRKLDIENQLNILILKTYKYHLTIACQSFGIQYQNDKKTRFIIDNMLLIKGIKKDSVDFISSGFVYYELKENKNYDDLKSEKLIKDIDSILFHCSY